MANKPPVRKTARQRLCQSAGAWGWWTALAGLVKPWLATIFAVLVMAAALVTLCRDKIPQVTDIASPSSAGEVQSGVGEAALNCTLVLLLVAALCGGVLFWGRSRQRLAPDIRAWLWGLVVFSPACALLVSLDGNLPPRWVTCGWFALAAWLLGVAVLWQANKLQAQADDGRAPGRIFRAGSQLPLDRWIVRFMWIARVKWIARRFRRPPTPAQRFVLLVFMLWLLASAPALLSILSLWVSKVLLSSAGENSLDLNQLSFVCLLALVALVSLMVGLWQLAKHERLGWPTPLLPWLPVWVLLLALYSAWTPDSGKGLNDDKPDPSAPAGGGYRFPERVSLASPPSANKPGTPRTIICVSGGGSRAALFTAGIFSRMWWDQPEKNFPGRNLLIQADAVSGVSGGALASAYLQEYLYRWMVNHDVNPDARPSATQAAEKRCEALAALFNQPEFGRTPQPDLTRTYPESSEPPVDKLPAQGQTVLERTMEKGPAPWKGDWAGAACQKANVQSFDDAPYFNAMRQDFVSATVAGLFQPWYGRGPNLENFWARTFHWYRAGNRDDPVCVSQFQPFERAGLLPALLLDSTITNSGTRLVITNVDKDCFRAADKFGFAADTTAVGDNDATPGDAQARRRRYDPLPFQINTLTSLRPEWDIPLTTAVRAAANVQYAFPTMRFRRTTPGPGDDVLELADGGLLDNTAVDAAMALVRAAKPPPPQARPFGKKSGPKARPGPEPDPNPIPLLIFQIDSGELPTDPAPQWWDPVVHHWAEPNRAEWRANLNLQEDIHSQYLQEMCRLYGDHHLTAVTMQANLNPRQGPETYTLGYVTPDFAFFRVRAGELLGEHVTTTWHLPVSERYNLYRIIMAEQQRATIWAAAAWIKDRAAFLRGKGLRGEGVSLKPVASP